MAVTPPIPAQIPGITLGWGDTFVNTNIVKSFFYDLNKLLLYVILANNQFNIFLNVPRSIAQQFNYTKDPDGFYNNSVVNYYSPALLTEDCLPILTEDGKYLVVT